MAQHRLYTPNENADYDLLHNPNVDANARIICLRSELDAAGDKLPHCKVNNERGELAIIHVGSRNLGEPSLPLVHFVDSPSSQTFNAFKREGTQTYITQRAFNLDFVANRAFDNCPILVCDGLFEISQSGKIQQAKNTSI